MGSAPFRPGKGGHYWKRGSNFDLPRLLPGDERVKGADFSPLVACVLHCRRVVAFRKPRVQVLSVFSGYGSRGMSRGLLPNWSGQGFRQYVGEVLAVGEHYAVSGPLLLSPRIRKKRRSNPWGCPPRRSVDPLFVRAMTWTGYSEVIVPAFMRTAFQVSIPYSSGQ